MSLLTKAAILAANDLPTTDVAVPEWGGIIRIRSMNGTERDAFEGDVVQARNEGSFAPANVRARFAAACIVDDKGQQLFDEDDVVALGKKSGAALDRVYSAIMDLNKVSAADIEAMAKN